MSKRRWLSVVLMTGALAMGQTAPKPASAKKTAGRATVKASDVQELRDLLAAQQQQMEAQRQQMEQLKQQLQQVLDQAGQANASAQRTQASLEQTQNTASGAQKSAEEAQRLADQASANAVEAKTALALVNSKASDIDKKYNALDGILGRFRFNGDIRVRGESFFQDFSGFQDRNRARIRVRFGFDGKLNEDFVGGIALATGSLGDPTTTNETFTNFFDRKTIGLDRGYVTYNPAAHKWLSVTGGKFPYQWQRTAVTGDPDINPEGFNEKLSFDVKRPVLKNVTAQAMQLMFNESSTGTDSYAIGGQISGKLEAGPWTATPSFMLMKWQGTSALLQASAFAVQATTTGSSTVSKLPVPGEGPGCASGSAGSVALPSFAPCAFSPNGMTNAVVLGPDGKTPRFLSGFFYADFVINNQLRTGWKRFPLNLMLEFEKNLDAADHPLDTEGNVISSIGAQDKEYGLDVSLGQLKSRNDIQLGYVWYRQEQDSVLASFAESDQRAPTNILQNRFYALWKMRSNTVASLTYWHGRALNTNLLNNIALMQKSITNAGEQEPSLNRFQFDVLYSF